MNIKFKVIIYVLLVFIFVVLLFFTVINLQESIAYSNTVKSSIEYTNQTGITDPLLNEWQKCVTKFTIYGVLGIMSAIAIILIAVLVTFSNRFIKDMSIFKPILDKLQARKQARQAALADKAEADKQARIAKLESELEELKKD